MASQSKANPSLVALSTKNPSSKSSLSPAPKKQPNTLQVDLSSKLASNGKLTSDECKKCLKNNLCLYCGAGDHKLNSCPKKQTTVSSKGHGALATADTPAAVSEKPSGKIESDPQDSTQTEDHVELPYAVMSPIQLNVSTLSNPHSLFVSLTSSLILGQDHLNKIPFQALVNFRSTHCFVDSEFVDTHHLKISATPLVALCLFDGSFNSTISEIANLPIIFSTGDCMNLNFYVTLLDSSCSLVLGYNWLA